MLMVLLLLPSTVAALEVMDAGGRPVPGASVELVAPEPVEGSLWRFARPVWRRTTDSAGSSAEPLPRIAGSLLLVDAEGHLPLAVECDDGEIPKAVRLPPGTAWEGRIEPAVAVARVCVEWTEEHPEWQVERRRARCTKVAGDGEFVVAGLPARGELELEVTAPGYLPWKVTHLAGEDWPRPGLEPGELLRGVVVSGRQSVSSATVTVRGGARVQTNDGGEFQIAVADLPVLLTARADGFRASRLEVTENRPVRLELEPREGLAGVLVGEQGEGIGEARFVVEHLQGEGRRSYRRGTLRLTDDGQFSLELDAPGRYALAIRAEGFEEHRLERLEVARGERRDLGVITLAVGARVQGRLVSAGGVPVDGVDVRLVPLGSAGLGVVTGRPPPKGVSDAEGRFDLRGLPPGRFEFRASHPSFAVAVHRLTVSRDEWVDLGDLVMASGVHVTGEVRDRNGEPRAGLSVRVTDPAGSSLFPLVATTTDAEGQFDLSSLDPAPYRVVVEGERLLLAQEVEVPSGTPEHQLDLVVGGVDLHGIVLREGEPVAGGALMLSSALDPSPQRTKFMVDAPNGDRFAYGTPQTAIRADVGPDGGFEVRDAPTGLLIVRFMARDGSSYVREVVVPDRARAKVAISLDGIDLRGEVVDGDSGAGLETTLTVSRADGRQVGFAGSDAAGAFLVEDLEPGVYVVEARVSGYASAMERVEVRKGNRPVVRLALTRGGKDNLSLRLLYEDGSPAALAELALLDRTGRMVRALLTDASGRRGFRGLSDGEYFVAWQDGRAGAGSWGPVVIPTADPGERVLNLRDGAPVTLRCAPEVCGGQALQHLAVYTEAGIDVGAFLSGIVPGARVSDEGALSLGVLSPGSYLVRVWMPQVRYERQVRVPPGGEPVTVRLW